MLGKIVKNVEKIFIDHGFKTVDIGGKTNFTYVDSFESVIYKYLFNIFYYFTKHFFLLFNS